MYPAYWFVLLFFTFVASADQYLRAPRVLVAHVVDADVRARQPVRRRASARLEPRRRGLLLCIPAAVRGGDRRTGAQSRVHSTVELAGLAVLFATGLIAIVAVGFGLDMPWVTVLPQHLGAFALGMLLAVFTRNRGTPTRPTDWRVSVARRGSGGPCRSRASSRSRSCFASIRSRNRGAAQAIGLNVCQMIVGICIVVPVVLGPQDHGGSGVCSSASRGVPRSGQLRASISGTGTSFGSSPTGSAGRSTTATGSWRSSLALPIVVFAASVSWYRVGATGLACAPAHRARGRARSARDPHAAHDA